MVFKNYFNNMIDFKNKEYKLSLKKLIIILIVTALLGGAVIISFVKVGSWVLESVPDFSEKRLVDYFSIFESENRECVPKEMYPVKVVHEESQIIEVVKKTSPAVVSIITTAEVPKFETIYNSPFSDLPDGFQDFFNFRIPERRQNGTEKVRVGAGSGFLVSSDGYIVTNKHVVDDEDAEYTVFLNDDEHRGEKVVARVLARHPSNDLAVIKIDVDNLPFLEFSDSDSLQVGQTAITIGYALGEFENTVSRGVISGLSRSIVAGGGFGTRSERLKNLIQSDAAINPGNSGGPMLDIGGNVIGVNVAMASGENIGFAIPGNAAKVTFEQVRDTGEIQEEEAAFLGVRYLSITSQVKENNNLPYDYGALIVRGETRSDLAVTPGSPADIAGLVENDIILEVEGEKVTERKQLIDLISKYKPEDEIELKIYHKGVEEKLKVKLQKK